MEHNHEMHHDHGHSMSGNNSLPQRQLRDFVPLLGVFAAIAAFTFVAVRITEGADVFFGMRMVIAAFFLVFGGFKAVRWRGFVSAYRMYDIVAKRSRIYAYSYPAIEIALGLAYLFGFHLLSVSVVTVVLTLIGAVGVSQELRKKNEIPCACLGVVFKIPMTYVTLIEDLVMAGMALFMIATFL